MVVLPGSLYVEWVLRTEGAASRPAALGRGAGVRSHASRGALHARRRISTGEWTRRLRAACLRSLPGQPGRGRPGARHRPARFLRAPRHGAPPGLVPRGGLRLPHDASQATRSKARRAGRAPAAAGRMAAGGTVQNTLGTILGRAAIVLSVGLLALAGLRWGVDSTAAPASGGPAFQGRLRSPIGTNLELLSYWSPQVPFVDVMKSSSEWFSGDAKDWGGGPPLDLDANGWVRSLRPGQVVRKLMLREFGDRYPGRTLPRALEGRRQAPLRLRRQARLAAP